LAGLARKSQGRPVTWRRRVDRIPPNRHVAGRHLTVSRKNFIQGMGCAAAGAALGAFGQRQLAPAPQPPPIPQPQRVNPLPQSEETFAQSGEDRIVHFILGYVGIRKKDYIDIGAWEPVVNNNTYLLYRLGYRGLLIEPNVTLCKKLREVRPHDRVLEAGIGVTAAREADYYVMTEPSWNTFSKEEAERQAKVTNGTVSIKEVIKMPLLDINQVMAEHLQRAPAFLSVDTQGLELAILKSIDYNRFRPEVICAETLVTGTNKSSPETAAFMETQGYVVRGMSFVNTIFVDSKII
jgi:FkbM family methyltransferase